MSVSQLLSQNKANCSLSVFDKENSIEFPLDFVYYLYIKSNPNPFFSPVLFYESLSSYASIDKKIKKKNINNQKIKKKKKKRNINNDLAILPSYNTTPLLSFLIPRNFPTICSIDQLCCPFCRHYFLSIL